MKIALIIENSQAAKSEIVHKALKSVAEPAGHTVSHYGMYAADDDAQLTYVMNGLLAGLLVNSGAADFVVSGCGTGGLVIDPTDAFLFGQINDGNAISMPYAKGFGWAAELNLQDCYRKLFEVERGVGYPKERAEIMAATKDMLTVMKSVDQDLMKAVVAGEQFEELFFANATDEALILRCRRTHLI